MEEDIFAGIGCYEFSEPDQEGLLLTAKVKAQQHLAISSDSPFSINDQQNVHYLRLQRDRELLKQEAEKILKEQENIKGRQTEIQEEVVRKPKVDHSLDKKVTDVPRIESKQQNNPDTQPKFRPLTGRIDCPNCSCDARNSVCSLCMKLDRRASIFFGLDRAKDKSITASNDNKKRCTLTELRQKYAVNSKENVPSVSDRVVPGRVYTISKALDDKRAQLAEAITELQLMKDQLRKKGDRLDKERRVVQLYRDQWRYGPNIGGPKSSSRERLGQVQQSRNYESRLDPQLARDSKAIEGFRHIEPGLKLRQYDKKASNPTLNSSKRSKSLESLRGSKVSAPNRQDISSSKSLSQSKKSSSDIQLSNPPEVIEEEMSVIDTSPPGSVVEEKVDQEVEQAEIEERDKSEGKIGETKVQKVAWIPVFGETEIKTIKHTPTVKISVLESAKETASVSRAENRSILKQPGNKSNKSSKDNLAANQGLVGEANRKLKFASDLLNRERHDSATKNQLVIRKVSQKSSSIKKSEPVSKESVEDKNMDNELKIREMLLIEEQLSEHQKQIAKLVEMQQYQNSAPKTSKNACCNHQTCHSSNKIPLGNKSLINNLRDRLNKTKTKLAKNLESEREKYMRLKLKVDNSLRKQSDLEKENELLKQSLSQCIDTCLKDITQTFESLSNTLIESVGSNNSSNRHSVNDDDNAQPDLLEIYSPESGNLLLKNAAQVMSDNNKIKEMKSRMDAVMEQRKEIFNELSKEKQKSNQLELQLKRSHNELSNLLTAKQKLELRLQQAEAAHNPIIPSTSSTSEPTSVLLADETNDANTDPLDSTTDDTFSGSIDRYRSFIKNLSPDMATLRQERKLILSEFDNIKKMLSEIHTADS